MSMNRDASVAALRSKTTLSVAGLALALSLSAQPVSAQEQERAKFLLPILISAITPRLEAGLGCLFSRLISFMGAGPDPACGQPNTTTFIQPGFAQGGQMMPPPPMMQGGQMMPPPPMMQGGQMMPPPPMMQGGQMMPPPPMMQGGQMMPPPPMVQSSPTNVRQAVQLAQAPLFTFIVNKLTDSTPQAQVKQVVQFRNVSQGARNLGFDIKTGEAFAVLFATTVPGRVRMINTDVNQTVSASDVYEALPGADNRMPRDWQGGIQMAGTAGTEYLDVEFTPCISQQYAGDPRVVQFQGILQDCSPESATKKYTPASAGSKGGVIGSGAKAMVFPPSANPGQPVAIAPENYSTGGTLTFRIIIYHQGPG